MMKKNKIYIICLILFLCFSIQTIYAADTDSDVCLTDNPATVEFDGTTFSELQIEINNLNDDDTIILNNAITQDNDRAIEINKNINIYGKDITIDAKNKSNIFNINSEKVVINNITFINGNNDKGGAIKSYADLTISNCNFINNTAGGIYGEGGSIYSAENLTITKSLFENNYASAGGAIYSYASESIIEASRFINNYAKWYGGAINHDKTLFIRSSLFSNNKAYSGGALHYTVSGLSWDLGGYVEVNDSNFTQNSAYFGGAVSTSSLFRINYENCNFINNYANKGAVTYKNAIAHNFFTNCIIEENNAEEGAVIYDDGAVNLFASISLIIMTNSTLKNNKDLKSSIFYARDSNIIINASTISDNSDNPIYNGKGNITVINSKISNNTGIFITQFYCGNITIINNTWDKIDPKIEDIINCTTNSTIIYSNSNLPLDLNLNLNSVPYQNLNSVLSMIKNDLDCASTVVRVSDTEIVLSHRRDGGADYNMTAYIDYEDNYVKQFKSSLTYFFHTKVFSNGWAFGTGGVDASSENEKVEALGSDMVLNENINMEALQLIMDTKKLGGLGHFLIVSPNGTYGNIITYYGNDFIKMGILGNGDYIVSPNSPDFRQEGHLDDISDPIYSNMNLSAHDRYGKLRHGNLVHHVTHDGEKFIDDIYGANDDGSYVDLDNGNIAENYWFNEEYTRAGDLPITLDKKYLGTYSNVDLDIDINTSDRVMYVSDSIKGFDYQVTLSYANNPLTGKKVQISFNGKNYTATTDSNGITSVKLSTSESGTYPINVRFEGYNNYAPSSKDAIIEVIKQSTIFDGLEYVTFDANVFTYQSILKTSDGNPLSNKKVTVTFNGKQDVYTDENGYLTVTLKANGPGKYKIMLEFKGDSFYDAVTAYTYINIAGQSDDMPISHETNVAENSEKILNESLKSNSTKNPKNTSKENQMPVNAITSDYSILIYILAALALGIIGIVIKRRSQ